MFSFVKLKRSCKNRHRDLSKIYQLIRLSLLSQYSKEKLIIKSNRARPLVISLTSYSKRIKDVHLVIESLGQQTKLADRIFLWLDEDEFNEKNIPNVLKKQRTRGLEIRYCPNYKSYKKIIPTLTLTPEANIITVDDDVIYPADLVERFEMEAVSHPDVVLCNRAHLIMLDDNSEIEPYDEWDGEIASSTVSERVFPTGVGGVYYPHGSLADVVTDIDEALRLAPHGDDIWLKAMAYLNAFPAKKVNRKNRFDCDFHVIKRHQDIGLFFENVHLGRNDKQLKKVFTRFNIQFEKV